MSTATLRDLAQAVVDTLDGDDDYATETALVALETALGSPAGSPVSTCAARAILAADAAAEARGREAGRREALLAASALVRDVDMSNGIQIFDLANDILDALPEAP